MHKAGQKTNQLMARKSESRAIRCHDKLYIQFAGPRAEMTFTNGMGIVGTGREMHLLVVAIIEFQFDVH